MKKPFSSAFIIAVLFCGLALVGTLHFEIANASTDVIGIIGSDTTWTKANSPYNLMGNMAVDKGVILTIEPGVTVNLNEYYMRVNGTLTARGTSTDNIYLNAATAGYIEFTASSTGWNSQTSTGSIIEKAVISTVVRTDGSSVMINDNVITKGISLGGGSPIVSKNTICISGDDPVSLASAIHISEDFANPIENTALIVDNTISGGFEQATISVGRGSPTIERNLISNSYGYGGDAGYGQAGIFIYGTASPIIKQNTITKNANGISLLEGNSNPTIINNNIEGNTNYNLYMNLGIHSDIGAANNWWGTTDTALINQKIWDANDDFTLGKVNYTPFLTAPNSQAMPDPNAPTPDTLPSTLPSTSPDTSPSPSQNSTSTPAQPNTQNGTPAGFNEIEIAILAVLIVIAVSLIVLIGLVLKKRR